MTKRFVLFLAAAALLVLPATAISYSPWAKPVETVDPKISELISVFRQVEPAPPAPEFLSEIYKPRKDGKTLDGGNPALARPAYPDPEKKAPPVWLVPGAKGWMMHWTVPQKNGAGGMGSGGPVDDSYFRKYGWISFGGTRVGKRFHFQTVVLVPDSITKVRLIFRKRSGKRFARDFTPHDNVVVNRDRRMVGAIINGKRFSFEPRVIFRQPRERR